MAAPQASLALVSPAEIPYETGLNTHAEAAGRSESGRFLHPVPGKSLGLFRGGKPEKDKFYGAA